MENTTIRQIDFTNQNDITMIQSLFTKWHDYITFTPHDNLIGFIVLKENNPIGMGFLATYYRTPSVDSLKGLLGECCGVYVVENERHKGVGSLIVNKIIEYSKQIGVEYIHIDAYTSATKMYEKCGFIYQNSKERRMFFPFR